MEPGRDERIYEDEVDLRDLFSVIWRRKWIIAVVVFLCVILAAGWALSTSRKSTELLVQLNFAGIDKHEYPDGTPFEMYDLTSQDILSDAAQAIEDPVHRAFFIEKPRSFIFVDPFIPVEVREKMKAMEREKQTYHYLPNQFFIRFVEPGSGTFSHEERKRVLLAIKDAFEEKYMKDYVNRRLVAVNLQPETLDAYDYVEVVEVYRTCLDNYAAYLEDMIEKAGLYRSAENGLAFLDLLDSVETLKKIGLYEIESIIKFSLETKQREVLLKKYQQRIKTLEKGMQKKEQEAASAKALLDEVWKHERGGLSLEGGVTSQNAPQLVMDGSMLEKISAKEYKAALLKRVLDAEVEASSLKIDKKYLEDEMILLQGREGADAGSEPSAEGIERSLEGIRKRIVSLGENINELSEEYLAKKYSEVTKVHRSPATETQYRMSPAKAGALSCAAGLILGIFIVFIVEFVAGMRAACRGDLRKEQR